MQLQQLQQERNHLALSAKDVISKADEQGRALTADETAIYDDLERRVLALDERIEAHLATAKRKASVNDLIARLDSPAGRSTSPDAPASTAPSARATVVPATAMRSRPLRAFRGPGGAEDAYKSGQWVLANFYGNQKAARFCLENGVGTDLRNAAMSEGSNAGGGFLVPVQLSDRVIQLRESYGVFRQNAFVQGMSRDVMQVPRWKSGITIGPVGENAAMTATNGPQYDLVQLVAKKAGGLVLLSSELSEDAAIDVAEQVAEDFAYALALYEDTLGFTGDGSQAHLGIRGLTNLLTTAGGLAGAVHAASGHDTFAEFTADDFATVMATLPAYAKAGAKWYCSSAFMDAVFGRLLAAAQGNTIGTLSEGYTPRWMGYPIVISQVLPAGLTTDYSDLPVCLFGDLSKGCVLGDRREFRLAPSDQRYFESDQLALRGLTRIDVVNHGVGSTTVAGPVVALCGN